MSYLKLDGGVCCIILGSIQESKGMDTIFQKKKAKYLKIWAKTY